MNQQDLIRDIQERFRQPGRIFDESQRRHWAAVEALKLGRGGITLVGKALRISRNTIRRGIQELKAGHEGLHLQASAHVRKAGGGRKSKQAALDREPPQRRTTKKA